MPGSEDVSADVNRKIRREQEMMEGLRRMRQSTRNETVRQQCDSQLQEAARNIAYLKERLSRLSTSDKPANAPKRKPEEKATRLDLLRYDLNDNTLMAPRIQLMLQQLEYKLSIEQQYKAATEKLRTLYKQNGHRKSRQEATENLGESQAKIAILTRSLKRYADMHLASVDDEAEDLVDNFLVPNVRRPLSGVLHIAVQQVADVDHTISWTQEIEMWVSIKADRAGASWKTRLSRNSQFHELFHIPVDQVNEIELAVYDREAGATDQGEPVALMWMRIGDIFEALRRKRVQRDLEASGWASADKVQELSQNDASATPSANATVASANGNGSGSGPQSLDPASARPPLPAPAGDAKTGPVLTQPRQPPPQRPSGPGGVDTTGPSASAAPKLSEHANDDVSVEGWFTLEPAGRVYLKLGFDRATGKKRPHSMVDDQRLGRHNAIRKRDETQEVHGHAMLHHQAYNIVRCSICGDFATSHYQCQDCELSCDRKCLSKIVTKCTALMSGDEITDEDGLSHHIPHRFEPVTNMRANWCCHCGYILPLASKKNVRKCTECGILCHAACAQHVPNFCGMSMEMASQIVSEIRSTRIRQATKAVAASSSSSVPATGGYQSSSPVQGAGMRAGSSTVPKYPSQAPPALTSAPQSSQNPAQAVNNSHPMPSAAYDAPGTQQMNPQHRISVPQAGQHESRQEPYWPYGTGKPTSQTMPRQPLPKKEPIKRKQVGSGPYLGVDAAVLEDEDDTLRSESTAQAWQQDTLSSLMGDRQPRPLSVASPDPLKSSTAQSEADAWLQESDQRASGEISIAGTSQPSSSANIPELAAQSEAKQSNDVNLSLGEALPTEPAEPPSGDLTEIAAAALGQKPMTSNTPNALRRRRRKVSLDDFSFLAVLGKGNFGKVMLAESKHTGRLYAVKVLKKNFIIENHEVESTRSEKRVFQIANRERHPFLVNLMACFQTENRIYFVMEYISGGDLMYHIQKEMFTARRAQFYAAEVLLALKHFHDNDVIYRDIKLDNILLGLDGHIKLADYGLCKENMGYGKTTGTFCGTPDFIAPEILQDQKYGRAVDWWALGVLMYQMLLGKSPFHGADEDEVYDAILSDEPLYPIHMPRESVSILQQLLTRDPKKRLGSSPRDALDIMEHPYFAQINFDDLLNNRVEPPFKPEVDNPTDVRNFDRDFTSEMPALTPMNSTLTQQMQEQFRGFSYSVGDSI